MGAVDRLGGSSARLASPIFLRERAPEVVGFLARTDARGGGFPAPTNARGASLGVQLSV